MRGGARKISIKKNKKMDDKSFCRNILDLVCFFDNGLWREVGGSLQRSLVWFGRNNFK